MQGNIISQNRPLISLLKYLNLLITNAKKWIPNIFTGFFSLIEFRSKLSTSTWLFYISSTWALLIYLSKAFETRTDLLSLLLCATFKNTSSKVVIDIP